jgi:hypothetical protein
MLPQSTRNSLDLMKFELVAALRRRGKVQPVDVYYTLTAVPCWLKTMLPQSNSLALNEVRIGCGFKETLQRSAP